MTKHLQTPPPTQPSHRQASDATSRETFIRTFFGVQLELLHQKIHDPHALPAQVVSSNPEAAALPCNADGVAVLTPQRAHQLLTHWTMFAQPMVQFERLPAQPGQASWDRLLELVTHASLRYSSQTLADQHNFATAVVTPLSQWLGNGWSAYEQQQAKLPWRGCFRAEVNTTGDSGLSGVASLHFYNAVRPASPFEDQPQRVAELKQITRELRSLKHVHTLRMASWLNHLPAVQQMFPPSYVASLVPNGPYPNGLGWWGQLITRQGDVHPQKAQQIREKIGFAHPRLLGTCPLNEMPS